MIKACRYTLAVLVVLCSAAGTIVWLRSIGTFVSVAHSQSTTRLCQAAPLLIERDQARALRPAFRSLVPQLREAPYYRLTLTPVLLRHLLTVHETLCYTNTTGDRLKAVALRLYDNYPLDNGFRPVQVMVNGHAALISIDKHDPTFALLRLSTPLLPEQKVDIDLTMRGYLPDASVDEPVVPTMQFLDGGAFGLFPHYLTLAWTYAQVGVYAHHHWSHPILTPHVDILSAPIAFFDATVTLPRSYGLVSSGITLSIGSHGTTQRDYRVVTGPVRDLTLEAAPHLSHVTRYAGGVRIESAYVPASSTAAESTARHYAELTQEAFSLATYLFAPYPYVKLTLVEAPIVASGLQWSTLIQLQNNQYLPHPWAPPGLSGVGLSSNEGVLLAHEVSHQWWYGLIGNDQVNNGFLSEGLATFSQMFLPVEQARHVHPAVAAHAWAHVLQDRHASVLYAYWLSGGRDVVIDQPAVTFPNGDPHYANYEKASTFFTLYAARFGRTALLRFLHRYAAHNMFKIATLDDLQDALVAAAPRHESAVRQMVTDWFRRPNLARVIDPHAVVRAPPWLDSIITQMKIAIPQLRGITLKPENEISMDLGLEPFDTAVRAYTIALTPSVTVAKLVASLRSSGWTILAPLSGGPGIARVECQRGGRLMALIAADLRGLPSGAQRLVRAQSSSQTVLFVEAKQT